MQRSEPQMTFRRFVEQDLHRAERLIVKVQDEIDPQWRIATPDGDWHVALKLPDDGYGRRTMLRRLSTFMAWKGAISFIVASELGDPDCVVAIGVAPGGMVEACMSRIRRVPKPWTAASFGPVEWLDRRQVGAEFIDLLPKAPRPVTPKEISALVPWFGREGKFPAVHLPTGEVRGV